MAVGAHVCSGAGASGGDGDGDGLDGGGGGGGCGECGDDGDAAVRRVRRRRRGGAEQRDDKGRRVALVQLGGRDDADGARAGVRVRGVGVAARLHGLALAPVVVGHGPLQQRRGEGDELRAEGEPQVGVRRRRWGDDRFREPHGGRLALARRDRERRRDGGDPVGDQRAIGRRWRRRRRRRRRRGRWRLGRQARACAGQSPPCCMPGNPSGMWYTTPSNVCECVAGCGRRRGRWRRRWRAALVLEHRARAHARLQRARAAQHVPHLGRERRVGEGPPPRRGTRRSACRAPSPRRSRWRS